MQACAICYELITSSDVVFNMIECTHQFHEHCIKEWLLESVPETAPIKKCFPKHQSILQCSSTHRNCPMCRADSSTSARYLEKIYIKKLFNELHFRRSQRIQPNHPYSSMNINGSIRAEKLKKLIDKTAFIDRTHIKKQIKHMIKIQHCYFEYCKSNKKPVDLL